jgi:hypothetical protein
MGIENFVGTVIALLGPAALIYSWFFYMTKLRKESPGWRRRLTLVSLVLTTLGAALLPIMMVLEPKADWSSYVGVPRQVDFEASWERFAVRALAAGLVVCFFGRARLIAPLALASAGCILFWFFMTVR